MISGRTRMSVLALALIGCASEPEVTYHADVRPLLERNCVYCHQDGSIAPFTMSTYDEARPLGEAIVRAVEMRTMPPWGQDPACREAIGSLWLPDAEVEAFQAWRDGGFAEGDPESYRAPVPIQGPSDPGPPDLDLAPSEGYTPSDRRPDDYRCVVLGEALTDDLFVRGAAVEPERIELAHHGLIYAVPRDDRAALLALDANDPAPGYACFGDVGLDDAQTLGGWVPGRETRLLPDGMAMRVPAGATLVLQMHYNTLGVDPIEPDASHVQLWTLPEGELPTDLVTVYPVAKTELDIAAGDPASVQSAMQRIPTDAHIIGVAPHMHLLGTRVTTTLHRPDGSEECLSDVAYDFDWQRSYGFSEAFWVPFGPDDRIEITCEYDNSPSNQPVVDGAIMEPQNVGWGDGTFDEMCLDYLAILSPYIGSGTGQICDGAATCQTACAADDFSCHLSCMLAAGDGCLFCGVEVAFSDCLVESCVLDAIPVGTCLDQCGRGEERLFDCLLGDCAAETEAYWACRQEAVAIGTCPEDAGACPGL